MAYAFVQQNAADAAATATTITVTLTPSAGNLLVFCVSGDALDTTSIALSDNLGVHNTFTQIGTDLVTAPGSDQRCAWWFAENCKGGATTFTATYSATTRFRTIYVAEYSGIATSGSFLNGARAEQANPGTGTDAVSSGNANATSQPALVWGFSIDIFTNATPTAGTGFTSRAGVWSTNTCLGRGEDKRVTATGNVAATFTTTSGTDSHGTGVGLFLEAVTPVFDDDTAPPATRPALFVPWAPIRVSADGEDVPATIASAPNEDAPVIAVPRALAWILPWPAVATDDLSTAAAPTMVDDGAESIAQIAASPFALPVLRVTDEDFPGNAPGGGSMLDEEASTSSTLVAAVQMFVPSRDASDGELPSIVAAVDDSAGVALRPGAATILSSRAVVGDEFAQFAPASGPSTAFPVRVSLSGRYLEQADGSPFLVCADTTWSLFVDLPLAGVSSYFATLVSQGFNALMGNAIEHHYTVVKPPKNESGVLPFTQRMDAAAYTGSPNGTSNAAGTQAQFASDNYGSPSSQSPDCTFINSSYWTHVETILDAALANNLLVFVWPGYLGFHAGDEGWMLEMTVWDAVTGAGGFTGQPWANATKSKLWNYGAWLANRWKNYPNIVWTMGGDYGTNTQTLSTQERAAVVSLVAGMKSVAGQQSTLWTAHWDRPCISDDNLISGVTWDLNFGYCDEAVAEVVRRGYSTAAKPSILGEYNYEDGLFGGSAPWRKYTWWGFLGGAAGGFYGQEQLWRFDDGSPGTDYTTLLATQARLDAARQFALWKSLPWYRLKPSGLGGMGTIITAGGGTASPQSTDYVAAAATATGDLLLAYVPPAHTGTITVDMTKMVTSCRARWFDPTNGSFTSIGTIANTGTHAFTTPATNSAGDTDFLLVLDISGGELDEDVSRWPSASFVPATPNRAGMEDEITASISVDDDSGRVGVLPFAGWTAVRASSVDDEALASIVDEDAGPCSVALAGDRIPVRSVPVDDGLPIAAIVDDDVGQPLVLSGGGSPVRGSAVDDELPLGLSASIVDDDTAPSMPSLSGDRPVFRGASADDEVVVVLLDDFDNQPVAVARDALRPARPISDDDLPSQIIEDAGWTFAVAWMLPAIPVRTLDLEDFPGTEPPPLPPGIDEDQPAPVLLYAAPGPVVPPAAADELPTPPVDPTAAWEDAIYQWVLTGSGLDPDHVIWASAGGPGGPAPAGLYISMRIIDVDQVSDDWLIPRRVGGGIVHHVRGTRHPTLELRCFAGESTGARRAELVLARVMAAVMLPTVAKALRQGDVGVGTCSKVRVLPGVRSGLLDPLAMVEVGLHIKIDVSEAGAEFTSAGVTTPGGVAQAVEKP